MIGRFGLLTMLVFGVVICSIDDMPAPRQITTLPLAKTHFYEPVVASLDDIRPPDGRTDLMVLVFFKDPCSKAAWHLQQDVAATLRWEAARRSLPHYWVHCDKLERLPSDFKEEWLPLDMRKEMSQGNIVVQFIKRYTDESEIQNTKEGEKHTAVKARLLPPLKELLTNEAQVSQFFARNQQLFPPLRRLQEGPLLPNYAQPLAFLFTVVSGFALLNSLLKAILLPLRFKLRESS